MERSLLLLTSALLIACTDRQAQEIAISRDSLWSDSIRAVQLNQSTVDQDSNRSEKAFLTEDDAQTEAYLKELNAEFIKAQYENASYSVGKVHYSPDSLFKIYVLEGIDTGTSLWSSYLHFNNGSRTIKEAIDFSSIDTIYRLPKEEGIFKYLVMQRSHSHTGSAAFQYLSADIVAIEKDSVTLQPFIVDGVKEDINTFSIEQLVFTEYEMSLQYNPTSATLKYQHVRNYLSCCSANVDSLREGTLRYSKGEFRSITKSIRLFEPEASDQ